ncbi:MAG: DUF2334 domain-containing protein [Byssovorax sp.]
MTIFLVRDDDPNATTRPERLARAYAPLFDAGVPVSFSVVPEVALDTRAPDGRRERFLDEQSEDCDRTVELAWDTPLSAWLRENEGLADVFVHGLSHRRIREGTEFGALDRGEAEARIARGLRIMERALGRRPAGFVPPWDRLSAGAVQAATAAFDLVSTGWIDRARLPLSAWPAFFLERLGQREAFRVGKSFLVRHRGGKISDKTRPEDVPAIIEKLAAGAEVAVIVLHHWMFWDDPEPHPVVRALAQALRSRTSLTVGNTVRHLRDRPPPGLGQLSREALSALRLLGSRRPRAPLR